MPNARALIELQRSALYERAPKKRGASRLGIVKLGCDPAIVRVSSLGFGWLAILALYFLIIPGIILVLIGVLVRRFRPLNRGNLTLWIIDFEMSQWLSLVIYGMFCLILGLVCVFLDHLAQL